MSCQFCNSQNCNGQCISIVGTGHANQGYINIHNQQMAMQRQASMQGQLSMSQYSAPPSPPTPEQKFMEMIDGKADEEIVIAFEMLVSTENKQQEELIRRLQENYQTSQQAKKDSFLSMCKRFRPTINEKLLERVSKLKAFW